MIDVQEGDLLVVNGADYPIRGVSKWQKPLLTSSFQRLAIVDAATKRNPVAVAGKRGTPETYLTGLKVTPLDSISADQLKYRDDLRSPYKALRTYLADADEFVELTVEDLQ